MLSGVSAIFDNIVRRLLAIAAVTALTASCGAGPNSGTPFTPDIQAISDAIATAAKYPASAVELTSSAVRMRISVSDAKLATADETTRNSEATAIVAATEQILASHPKYGKLEAISVAIIHPSADGDAHKNWHTEDVVEFRKGPNQRFSMHIT
jgi:hypothetical protein